MTRRWGALVLAFVAYLTFLAGARNIASSPPLAADIAGSVVLPPTLQTVLYMGDRYLAANVESTRVLMTGGDLTGSRSDYFHRLHEVVSVLNPCHEDNYYIANALLAWAGGVDAALSILREATTCRFWDEVPPFFLGYNLYFFKQDHKQAKEMLFLAADRSTENRAAMQRLGIMLEAKGYPDLGTARKYLASQRDQSRDPKLREMLEQRITRLDGLIALRSAQEVFERRFGRALENPQDLFTLGLLPSVPVDPLGLGYEFRDGQFGLRELKIRGMEERRR